MLASSCELHLVSEVNKIVRVIIIREISSYGGPPIKDQITELKRGAEVVVSSQGRIIDLLCANGGKFTNLHRVTFLVMPR